MTCSTRLPPDSAQWSNIPFTNHDSIISKASQATFDKVQDYNRVGKSLKRCIETLGKVSIALKELVSWVSGVVRSWFQEMLAYVGFGLSKHENLLCANPNHTKKCGHGQASSLPSCVLKDCAVPDYKSILENLEKSLALMKFAARQRVAEDGDKDRFMRCAYRTVRCLSYEQASLLNLRPSGPEILREVPDYQGVGEDLVQFLKDCGERLQRKQVQKIEQLFQQVKAGQELLLEQEEAVSSIRSSTDQEIRESKIADLARRIKLQIKRLAVGESCLIPGGHY